MPKFQIFSDGSADMPLSEATEKNITIIPFYVSFDGQTYLKELKELSLDVFYNKMINEKIYPKTSLPSISDYSDAFEKAILDGKDVICFTITDTLSGSFQSASTAKDILKEKYPDSNIYIVNSLQATGSQYLLINETIKLRDADFTALEAYEKIEEIKNTAGIIFMVGTLDYLAKGGRIGRVASISGSLLKIKPLIQLNNGYIDKAGIVRSRKAGLTKIAELTKAFFEKTNRKVSDYTFLAGSTNTPNEYEHFKAELLAAMPDIQFSGPMFQIGATIATHTGPDTIGVCFVKKINI